MRKNISLSVSPSKAIYAKFACGTLRDSLAFEPSKIDVLLSSDFLKYLAFKRSPFFFDLYSVITCGRAQCRYGSVETRSSCENKIPSFSSKRGHVTEKHVLHGRKRDKLGNQTFEVLQLLKRTVYTIPFTYFT